MSPQGLMMDVLVMPPKSSVGAVNWHENQPATSGFVGFQNACWLAVGKMGRIFGFFRPSLNEHIGLAVRQA